MTFEEDPRDVFDESTVELVQWPRTLGGQHVGTPRPDIIAIHRPTGLAVRVDDERSLLMCKEKAIKRLRVLHSLNARLWEVEKV